MTPAEAQALLAVAAAFDNRKPDADTAMAWSLAMDGYRFEDCRDAIVAHYRVSREWIMPADVIDQVKKVRGGRIEDVAPSPPAGMDPDDTEGYVRWLAATRQAIADGREPPEQSYPATRQIGELRGVLRAVPAIEAKPRGRSAEHQEALENARAELPPPAPIPDPIEDETDQETA